MLAKTVAPSFERLLSKPGQFTLLAVRINLFVLETARITVVALKLAEILHSGLLLTISQSKA